mmetsp:Transcript_7044/g.20561  ORF Transcript_7044/g.20561 Transcript_7044/m.20561 type:complete len:330 (-) Transcript_7044:1126-2115(-)
MQEVAHVIEDLGALLEARVDGNLYDVGDVLADGLAAELGLGLADRSAPVGNVHDVDGLVDAGGVLAQVAHLRQAEQVADAHVHDGVVVHLQVHLIVHAKLRQDEAGVPRLILVLHPRPLELHAERIHGEAVVDVVVGLRLEQRQFAEGVEPEEREEHVVEVAHGRRDLNGDLARRRRRGLVDELVHAGHPHLDVDDLVDLLEQRAVLPVDEQRLVARLGAGLALLNRGNFLSDELVELGADGPLASALEHLGEKVVIVVGNEDHQVVDELVEILLQCRRVLLRDDDAVKLETQVDGGEIGEVHRVEKASGLRNLANKQVLDSLPLDRRG